MHRELDMNLDDFRDTWQQHHSETSATITINDTLLTEMKVNARVKEISHMKWARMIESIAFFFIIVVLCQYIMKDFSLSAPTVSACILSLFALIGLAGNIGQIVLIAKIDFSKPVGELQRDIYRICSHKLHVTKLLFMSVPFYMAYVVIGFDILLGVDLFQQLEQSMVWFYSLSSVLLLTITSALSVKLHYRNISTPWVKHTIRFIVGERLVKIAQFINSIETTDK